MQPSSLCSAVAERSGVARPAVRHFVGNRNELIAQAVAIVVAQYTQRLQRLAGDSPSIHQLLDVLFGPEWINTTDATDLAFDALLYEASRDDDARHLIGSAYRSLRDELTRAILAEPVPVDHQHADRTSYVVLCLAEQNATFQAFGFDSALSAHCHNTARELVRATLQPQDTSTTDAWS